MISHLAATNVSELFIFYKVHGGMKKIKKEKQKEREKYMNQKKGRREKKRERQTKEREGV